MRLRPRASPYPVVLSHDAKTCCLHFAGHGATLVLLIMICCILVEKKLEQGCCAVLALLGDTVSREMARLCWIGGPVRGLSIPAAWQA